MSLSGKAAAIGIAELKPWKEPPPGVTPLKLMAQLTADVLADAGLEKSDLDGLLVGMPFADPGMIYPASLAEVLGINPRMLNVVDIGGASAAGMIWRAAAAIDSANRSHRTSGSGSARSSSVSARSSASTACATGSSASRASTAPR